MLLHENKHWDPKESGDEVETPFTGFKLYISFI